MLEELKCLLEKLDRSCEKQSEHTIYSHINRVTKDDKSLEATAERMAFAFYENHESKENGFSNPFILKTRTGMSVLLFRAVFIMRLIGRFVALAVQPFLTNRLLVVRVLQSERYHRFCYTPAAAGPCLE